MVKLENVTKNYGNFHLGCSLEVPVGCVTGLIGANGAGKSTTFKLILGLTKSDGGKVSVFGKDAEKLGKAEKENMGVVLAETGFSGYLTIKKVIPIMASMYTRFNRTWFENKCQEYQLPMDKFIKDFSTGMRAKLKILIAISHEAKLLVLDEPTAGLDAIAREDLLDLLREYMETEGRSILISSHISSDLEGFCDDLYMIQNGSIIFHVDTDELLDEYGVLKLTPEQYEKIDRSQIMYQKEEALGYKCLTKEKSYYLENYPEIVMEKSSIDEVITIVEKGEAL